MQLTEAFRSFDRDSSHTLSLPEFSAACSELALGLSALETQALFKYFDTDNSNSIDYKEFCTAVRGTLNSFKKQVVLAVWELLDPTSQNRVDLEVMVSKYDGRRHPEVKQGRATPREVDAEFSSSARLHHSAYCPTSQFLSKDEFIDLYAHFAAVYPDDRLFELTLSACWGLPDSRLHRDARDGARPASKGTGLWAEQMHGSRAEAPEVQSKPDLYDRRQASSAAKPAGSSSLFARGVYNRR